MTQAPFTQDQINHIDEYQHAGIVHELTCANGHGALVAEAAGLSCPQCEYTQDWVPDGVADGSFLQSQSALHSIFMRDV